MADFTLSTGKVQRSSARGGLRAERLVAGGGAGLLRGSTINPRTGNVGWTDAVIPETVEDLTGKGIQHFMQETAKAAFDYEQRESTFIANKLALEYTTEARKQYTGWQDEEGNYHKGFMDTTGEGTLGAYPDFKRYLEDTMTEALSNAEPRVRQKALLQMQSSKDSILGKASLHRASEMNKAEEEQRYLRVKDLETEFTLDPSAIHGVDPKTGQTGKAKFYAAHKTTAEADKAWFTSLINIGRNIYLTEMDRPSEATTVEGRAAEHLQRTSSALQRATEFYTNIGQSELVLSTEHANQALDDLRKYRAAESDAYNSNYTTSLREREYRREQNFREGQIALSTGLGNNQPLTREEATKLMIQGKLDPKVHANYIRVQFGDHDKMGDPQALIEWETTLRNAMTADFLVDGKSVKYAFWNDTRLGVMAIQRLIKLQDNLTNPDFRNQYQEYMDKATLYITSQDFLSKIPGVQDSTELELNEAGAWIQDAILNKVPREQILSQIDAMYFSNKKFVAYDQLPRFIGISQKPELLNDEQVKEYLDRSYILLNKGAIDKRSHDINVRTAQRYALTYSALREMEAKKLEREKKNAK